MSKQRNFYEVLNSTPNSSFDELKSNYKLLILQCHPDKLQQDKVKETTVDGATVDPNVVADDNAEFVMINKAWNTLKDPLKRKHYDAELLLTKFQMHSNIFERLTLDDMMEHEEEEIETDTETETEEVVKEVDDKKMKIIDCEKNQAQNNDDLSAELKRASYIYTYDCRCGGQYIIDESAAANNGIYKSSKNTSINFNKIRSNHKCTQQNSIQNIDCDNTRQETVESAEQAKATAADATFISTDAEVMVECSECSLVIMLSNKMQQSANVTTNTSS